MLKNNYLIFNSGVSLVIICGIISGLGNIAGLLQISNVDINIAIALRFCLSSLIFFLIGIKGFRFIYPDKRLNFILFIEGISLYFISYYFIYSSIKFIPTALSALIFGFLMSVNMLIERLVFGVRFSNKNILGSFVAIVGLALFLYEDLLCCIDKESYLMGVALSILGLFFYSIGVNLRKYSMEKYKLAIEKENAISMFWGGIVSFLFFFLKGGDWGDVNINQDFILSLVYLVLGVSLIFFLLYFKAIELVGTAKASYSLILGQVVAVLVSVLFEGMSIGLIKSIGILMIISSGFFILKTADS